MKLTHHIRGYDKTTDKLRFEQELPEQLIANLKKILSDQSSQDPALIGTYELDASTLHRLATALGVPIDAEEYAYFLDCSADWEDIRVLKRRTER